MFWTRGRHCKLRCFTSGHFILISLSEFPDWTQSSDSRAGIIICTYDIPFKLEVPVALYNGHIPKLSCMQPECPEMRQPAVKLSLMSPGFVCDPYSLSEPISFEQSCFTISGWKRRKEEFISKLKTDYALAKLRRKFGFSEKFHEETVHIYQEINTLMAKKDEKSLREFVTENMYCALRNEIKGTETGVHVHWELIMPMVKIRTLRARLIGTDRTDIMKSFAQITVEFLSNQKFEAYDSNGAVGDKDTEVLVHDIWVFERSLFHDESCWRLCGIIKA